VLDTVAGQVGSAKGIILIGSCQRKNEDAVRKQMEKYIR
jgi:hypothetical protein